MRLLPHQLLQEPSQLIRQLLLVLLLLLSNRGIHCRQLKLLLLLLLLLPTSKMHRQQRQLILANLWSCCDGMVVRPAIKLLVNLLLLLLLL